ncbi:MAG: hypothetical protein PQJ48_10330 [Sphaerochaetaceae bacterium]|nr:hypothetical protein [Sphaerochaetaceae bacterium]
MRKLAIGASVLSIILLVLNVVLYNNIPQIIPVLRGLEAEKTFLLSIRILVINSLTLAAFLILSKSIRRSQRDNELNTYGSWILIFIMGKMLVEFIGLFYEDFLILQGYFLLAGFILLFAYGVLRHRYLINKEFWKPVRFITSEKIVLSMLLIAYIAVNIPVISIISSQ